MRDRPLTSDIGTDIVSTSQPFSTGAGHVILVAREVSGLSQRKLATRMRTSQPTVAKLETGSRMPTARTLMRAAAAAGLELVLGLRDPDADPPLPGDFVLLGASSGQPTRA